MTSPSTTAGKACAECGIPDPCILDVIADFPSNKEKHRWSRDGRVHFDLLDDGDGAQGTITITSNAIVRTSIKPGWKKRQETRKMH